jgi:hypothetical protein
MWKWRRKELPEPSPRTTGEPPVPEVDQRVTTSPFSGTGWTELVRQSSRQMEALMGTRAYLDATLGSRLVRPRHNAPVASPPSAREPTAERSRREPIPERVRHEVWRRDQGRCVDCGSRERLEFDHLIPVSKGGSNTARNIELRCERCNRSKGARI